MSTNLSRLALSATIAATTASFLAVDALRPQSFLSLTNLGQSTAALAQDAEEGVNVRVYQTASPAVVSIEAESGTGSGSIISSDGLVLTNAHVVSGAQTVTVTLADGRRFQADVVAFGEGGLDLAAVRIRGQANLPTVSISRPGLVAVGQRAFAIGNPFGQFQGTFTTGIISRIDSSRGLIQTDASINPGNSGGPLLNSQGAMIGVNSAIFSPRGSTGNTGIGFAISIERVQPFLTAVREGRAPRTAQQSPMLGGGQVAQRISLDGAPIQGRLDSNSSVLQSDNSYYNTYTFEGRAGQQVVVEMTSRELNAYLILLTPDGDEVGQDNDSGGDRNSRLAATLPTNGIYTILANTFEPGESGRYRVRVATSNAAPPSTPTARTLLQEQGQLDVNSPVLQEDNSLYQDYSFQGTSGQSVTITMESNEFDTYLILMDSEGQVIEQNDDATPNSTNSAITVRLPRTGSYRVIANAYDRNGRGRYILTIR